MFDLHDLFFLCFKTRAKLGLCAMQAKRFIVLHERPSATAVNVTHFFFYSNRQCTACYRPVCDSGDCDTITTLVGKLRPVVTPSAVAVNVIPFLQQSAIYAVVVNVTQLLQQSAIYGLLLPRLQLR